MKQRNFPYTTQKYRSKTKGVTLIKVALIVGIALWISLIARWGYIYAGHKQNELNTVRATKTLKVANNEASHYPPIKTKKLVTIHLINGSGNLKEEEEVVAALVGSGYTLLNIELGESEVVDGMGTTITANADFEVIVAHIRNVLLPVIPEITDGTPSTDPNVASGYDVVIITGTKTPNTILPRHGALLPIFEPITYVLR